jgi:hypothetical protein
MQSIPISIFYVDIGGNLIRVLSTTWIVFFSKIFFFHAETWMSKSFEEKEKKFNAIASGHPG